MNRFAYFAPALLLLLLAPFSGAKAQYAESPLYETRGAWFTLVYRLDWPPYDGNVDAATLRTVQQKALRDRFALMKARGMNTVVFQVLFHGTAVYPSARLPFSDAIAGAPGRVPDWDPLAYAVEQAHALGMELHAWINVVQMGSPTTNISETVEPQHVRFAHPEWIKEFKTGTKVNDYWINMAIPQAREWLVGNVEEIVRNYDVDAVHFDYLRYPEMGFPDDYQDQATWPNGEFSTDNWRRENINRFIRAVYPAVKAIKPWVKVGSAPIGTRKYYNGAPPGYWGFDHLYQDAATWMREGFHDYVAPQLYFDIGEAPNPGTSYNSQDYSRWVDDWLANSFGRHVYAGLATYMEAPGTDHRFDAGEIERQVSLARTKGLDGQVQFRYAQTAQVPLSNVYSSPALPPRMPWMLNASAPTAPQSVASTWDEAAKTMTLSWGAATSAPEDPMRRYAIFRSIGTPIGGNVTGELIGFVGVGTLQFKDVLDGGTADPVYYGVAAQSLLGFLSPITNALSTASEGEAEPYAFDLKAPYPNPATASVVIRYSLEVPGDVTLAVYDLLGREVNVVRQGREEAGLREVAFDVTALAPGAYLVSLRSGDARDVETIVISR